MHLNRCALETLVEQVLHDWRQPALALSVVAGDTAVAGGYGIRCIDGQCAVDDDTVFALASCSKPFAVTAALMLQAEGRLGLDDRVLKLLPEFRLSDPRVTEEVTIRDLLCNRLGLLPSEGRHRQAAVDRKDLIARMRHQPFRHAFRGGYGYCTDAFTVLGEVLEAASGMAWPEFLKERIGRPLGLRRTNACHRAAQAAGNVAHPHLRAADGRFRPIPWRYEDHVAAPAGGVNSTASDMALWLSFLLTGKAPDGATLLPLEILQQAHTPHTPDDGPFVEAEMSQAMGDFAGEVTDAAYGLGWYTHRYGGHRIVYHTGSIDGFRAITGLIPELDFAVSVLANADNPFLPRMVFQTLIDHALGRDGRDWSGIFLRHQNETGGGKQLCAPPRDHLSEQECAWLAPLEGDYLDATGFGRSRIIRRGKRFILEAGALEFLLLPVSPTRFEAHKIWPYHTGPQFTADVILSQDGTVTGFRTSQAAVFRNLSGCPPSGQLNPMDEP